MGNFRNFSVQYNSTTRVLLSRKKFVIFRRETEELSERGDGHGPKGRARFFRTLSGALMFLPIF